jgi:hypothetical protein
MAFHGPVLRMRFAHSLFPSRNKKHMVEQNIAYYTLYYKL